MVVKPNLWRTLAKSLCLVAIVGALIGVNRFVDSKWPPRTTQDLTTPQDLGAKFVPEIGQWVLTEDQIKALSENVTVSEEEVRQYAEADAFFGDMFLVACLATMYAAGFIIMRPPTELTPLFVFWTVLSLSLAFGQLPALATAALAISSGIAFAVQRNSVRSRTKSTGEP